MELLGLQSPSCTAAAPFSIARLTWHTGSHAILWTGFGISLCCLWSCHAKDASKISPSANISRPQDLTVCCSGLAEWVAKVARDALLAAVPFPC